MFERLIVFVEEPSMEAALKEVLPGMLGETSYQIVVFQCKDDLIKKLPDRLRGYTWIPSGWAIMVIVDRDDDDGPTLKNQLEDIAIGAGLRTKGSTTAGSQFHVVNRIACEELEAWYFGDWQAVREAYPKVPETIPKQQKFRDPDAIAGGTWEAFERVMQRAGYFKGGLRKIEAARNICCHMDASRTSSRSFRMVAEAVETMKLW